MQFYLEPGKWLKTYGQHDLLPKTPGSRTFKGLCFIWRSISEVIQQSFVWYLYCLFHPPCLVYLVPRPSRTKFNYSTLLPWSTIQVFTRPQFTFFILIDTIFYQYFAKLPLISILTRIWPFCYLVKVKIVRCWRVQPSFLEPWICQLSPRRRTDCYLFCIFTRPQRARRTDGQHLLHLFHLLLTHLIFVTGTTREKSVMWRNFTFLYMKHVEKAKISPHVD